jgi:hypothetical protein
VVTEIDWAPQSYNGTWGIGTTGTAGQWGFGANFKAFADTEGNVSWNLLAPDDLLDKGNPTGGIAFNNDPQACANACYNWFKQYATYNTPASACNIINNGIYEIEFQTDPGKVLDLANNTDANGTAIRPWNRLGGTAQRWRAVDIGNGYWRIISMSSSSNRCIDLQSANTAPGTSIRLWDNYSNDAQAWQITSVGGGYYKILSKVALNQGLNRGWDVLYCNMNGTASLQLYNYLGTSSCQKFKFNYITTASPLMATPADKSLNFEPGQINQNASFNVYPNPGNGAFTVSIPYKGSNRSNLVIYNLQGKKVFSQTNLNAGEHFINSGLNKGLYILKINTPDQSFTKKVVIE